MKISIFGLGYVGCVTAACLAKAGHDVLGVDVNVDKVEMINAGRSPVVERGLDEIILENSQQGRLRATTDYCQAVLHTDASLVCVGTPSNTNGSLNLEGIKTVSHQIGSSLSKKHSYHCVIFRSTVLPGTVRNILIPILRETSLREVNKDFDVCFNPEFLREGSSIADFYHPPYTLIGQQTTRGGEVVVRLYDAVDAPVERTAYEIAEMVKYTSNSYHALKVVFANEMGVICKGLGIDSHRVMELFAQDKKLNTSAAYLRPGFAFGGSCLPKDLRALLYSAKELDLTVPVLSSILESNRLHIQRAIDRILATKSKQIAILGLSFKAGTDDLRESPTVLLIESLIGKGCNLKIYDSDVYLAKLFGANKEFIQREIPHISSLLCSNLQEVVQLSDVIVVCKSDKGLIDALKPYWGQKVIIDLIRLDMNCTALPDTYQGICW